MGGGHGSGFGPASRSRPASAPWRRASGASERCKARGDGGQGFESSWAHQSQISLGSGFAAATCSRPVQKREPMAARGSNYENSVLKLAEGTGFAIPHGGLCSRQTSGGTMNALPESQPPLNTQKRGMGMGAKFAIGCGGVGLLVLVATLMGLAAHRDARSSPSHSAPQGGALISENEKAVMQILAQVDLEQWGKGERVDYINEKDIDGIIRVSADKLQRDYSANEVNADLNYKDKDLVVAGTVSSIDRGIGSTYFLSLKGGDNMFMTPHIQMADGFVNYLAGLKKGQQVALFGRCEGMLMGSATLSECKPIENWAKSEAKDYTEKYIRALPEIVRNKYTDGLRLAAGATAAISVLNAPNAFITANDNVGKLNIALYESLLMTRILEHTLATSSPGNAFKKYGVDNKSDYIDAVLADIKHHKLNPADSEKFNRSDFVANMFVKDPNGNELSIIENACKKYGLTPGETRSLLDPNEAN